jgi:hypothetical protein
MWNICCTYECVSKFSVSADSHHLYRIYCQNRDVRDSAYCQVRQCEVELLIFYHHLLFHQTNWIKILIQRVNSYIVRSICWWAKWWVNICGRVKLWVNISGRVKLWVICGRAKLWVNIWVSKVVSKHLWASEVVSKHLWASEVVSKHLWASEVVSKHLWASKVVSKHLSASEVVSRGEVCECRVWTKSTLWDKVRVCYLLNNMQKPKVTLR